MQYPVDLYGHKSASCGLTQKYFERLLEKYAHFCSIFRFCLKIKYLIILAETLLCCEEMTQGDREIKDFKSLMNLRNVCDVSLRQIRMVL